MNSRLAWFIVIGSVFGLYVEAARGQNAPPKVTVPVIKLTAAEVKSLVAQLGGSKAAERQAAEAAAIPALVEATGQANKTATANIFDILEAHVEKGDKEAKLAAFGALRKLLFGNRPDLASAAKKIMEDHKDLQIEGDAAKLASVSDKAERPDKKPSPPKANPNPKPAAVAADPATNLRRQSLEQQVKDAELAIEKIKKLDIPKQLKDAQLSAAMQALQQIRNQLKQLDGKR